MHAAFAGALRWSGVPEVAAPPYFWAPRSRPGNDALLDAARADAANWADERLMWHQAWDRFDVMLNDPATYRRRRLEWETEQERRPPIRPNRRLGLPLFAAYANDVAGLSAWAIGDVLGMRGTIDKERKAAELERRWHSPRARDRSRKFVVFPYYKGMPEIISRGQQLAFALGAWPWAQYAAGTLAEGWWTDDATREALAEWAARHGLEPGRRPGPPGAENVCVSLLPL